MHRRIATCFFTALLLAAATSAYAQPIPSKTRIRELVDGLEGNYKGAQNREDRNKMGQELDSYGKAAVPALAGIFNESGDPVRKSIALTALRNILKDKSTGFLLRGLQNHDPEVRLQSVYLISRYRDDRIYDGLVKLVETETDPAVMKLAMLSIADFQNRQAMYFLTGKLRDMDPLKREAADWVIQNLWQKITGKPF